MLNQQALDNLYSATYMEDYLDCMENLPDDMQRYVSRMREVDIGYSVCMEDLETSIEALIQNLGANATVNDPSGIGAGAQMPGSSRDKLGTKSIMMEATKALMKAQDLGDEKLQLAQSIQDNVENKARQLELDKKNLGELTKLRPREYGRETETQEATFKEPPVAEPRNIKRARRGRHDVYITSILGPSTLAASNFVDNIKDEKPSTSAAARNAAASYQAQISAEKQVSSSAAASNAKEMDIKPAVSTVEDSRPSGSGRGADKAGGSSTRGETESVSHSRVAVKQEKLSPLKPVSVKQEKVATSSASSSSTKKQNQKAQATEKKHKKRKTKQNRNQDASPQDPIDPDEPTYCLCDQISYGEMIGCDNDLCPIEWFHFSCVNLTHKPKGKWYCPKCRADKPNVMKSKTAFLKELEKYNREKEEKACEK